MRPSRSSREGIRRTLRMSAPRYEVLEKAQAVCLALLGMKLHGPDVAGDNGRRKRHAVIAGGRHQSWIGAVDVVAVNEVEHRIAHALEERAVGLRPDVVPADVRHLQPVVVQAAYRRGQPAEAFVTTAFLA